MSGSLSDFSTEKDARVLIEKDWLQMGCVEENMAVGALLADRKGVE